MPSHFRHFRHFRHLSLIRRGPAPPSRVPTGPQQGRPFQISKTLEASCPRYRSWTDLRLHKVPQVPTHVRSLTHCPALLVVHSVQLQTSSLTACVSRPVILHIITSRHRVLCCCAQQPVCGQPPLVIAAATNALCVFIRCQTVTTDHAPAMVFTTSPRQDVKVFH